MTAMKKYSDARRLWKAGVLGEAITGSEQGKGDIGGREKMCVAISGRMGGGFGGLFS